MMQTDIRRSLSATIEIRFVRREGHTAVYMELPLGFLPRPY
jgi:hypothetical protein